MKGSDVDKMLEPVRDMVNTGPVRNMRATAGYAIMALARGAAVCLDNHVAPSGDVRVSTHPAGAWASDQIELGARVCAAYWDDLS